MTQKPSITTAKATLEIVPCPAAYIILYDGSPFTYRKIPRGRGTVRYLRTNFQNDYHARHAADRLNEMFATEAFTVMTVTAQ